MKKTLIFILSVITVIYIFGANVNATEVLQLPELYVEEGMGNETYLYKENYTIISGVVDWHREGTYTVRYGDSLGNVFERKIIVIPKTDSYYSINKDTENQISIDKNNQIVDIFYITESSFYVISNYQVENPTAMDQEKISVMYYENHKFKWEYRYYKYSRFVSACLKDENILITGLVYNENNYYIKSIVLFEVTKERQIIKSREIVSDKSCFVYDLYFDDSYIYLITNTNGNKIDYEKYKKDEESRVVIFKILYQNFQIVSGAVIDDLENFIVIDSSYYDRRLTINILLKEKQGIYTNCIYEYNDKLTFVDKYYFTISNKDYLGHQVTRDEICFFSIDYSFNQKCVKVEYLNKGVENKNILLDLQNIHYINYVEVVKVDGNNIYLSLSNKTSSVSYFLGFCKVNSFTGVKYFSTTIEEIGLIKTKITNGVLINFYYKQNKIYTRSIKLLEIETFKNESKNDKIKYKRVFVNCEELIKHPYLISVNKQIFGMYKNVYCYIDDDYNEYYLFDEIEILFNCNVIENEKYQKGYKLLFNGLGTLNGVSVDSGYIVNSIGKYQLVIDGYNDTNIIAFSISDLTINHTERQKSDFHIGTIAEYIMPYKEEDEDETQYDYIVKDNLKNTVPISIAILSIGIILFLLLRKKK